MALVKFVAFIVFEILYSLVFMWNSLNVNNCWRRQNFKNCSAWARVYLWWNFRICCYLCVKFNILGLLVSHKMSFCENEAVSQCVTMRKSYTSIRATTWHLKFWHRYRNVRIRFFWGERQVSIAQKGGFGPVKFLNKTWSWLQWPSQLSKWNMTLKCFRNLTKYYNIRVH